MCRRYAIWHYYQDHASPNEVGVLISSIYPHREMDALASTISRYIIWQENKGSWAPNRKGSFSPQNKASEARFEGVHPVVLKWLSDDGEYSCYVQGRLSSGRMQTVLDRTAIRMFSITKRDIYFRIQKANRDDLPTILVVQARHSQACRRRPIQSHSKVS